MSFTTHLSAYLARRHDKRMDPQHLQFIATFNDPNPRPESPIELERLLLDETRIEDARVTRRAHVVVKAFQGMSARDAVAPRCESALGLNMRRLLVGDVRRVVFPVALNAAMSRHINRQQPSYCVAELRLSGNSFFLRAWHHGAVFHWLCAPRMPPPTMCAIIVTTVCLSALAFFGVPLDKSLPTSLLVFLATRAAFGHRPRRSDRDDGDDDEITAHMLEEGIH